AVLEDAALQDKNRRAEFYRTYQLENLQGSVLQGIPESAAMKQRLEEFYGGRLEDGQIVLIGFEGQKISGGEKFVQLELASDVLGMSANKRADFPVPLLGARLVTQPEAIRKLGDAYVL